MGDPNSLPLVSVTAMADKLNVEFALIHRKRDTKSLTAPDRMELLVGDVKDKVRHLALSFAIHYSHRPGKVRGTAPPPSPHPLPSSFLHFPFCLSGSASHMIPLSVLG